MIEWKDDDEFTTTFGTLKRSMAEAAGAERERIVALLESEMCAAYGEDCTTNPDCTSKHAILRLIDGVVK